MQCAAVISRSFPGLSTTLAVQKWLPLALCSNSAPTRSPDPVGSAKDSAEAPGVGADRLLPYCGSAPSRRDRVQYAAPTGPGDLTTSGRATLHPASAVTASTPAVT